MNDTEALSGFSTVVFWAIGVGLLLGALLAALYFKSFDTQYAPGYSAKAFKSIKLGDTEQRVVSLLGAPLSAYDSEPYVEWIYSANEQKRFCRFSRLVKPSRQDMMRWTSIAWLYRISLQLQALSMPQGCRSSAINSRDQVQVLRLRQQPLTEEAFSFLAEWPDHLVIYLADPGNPVSCEMLVGYLRDPRWPVPLADGEADELLPLLCYESNDHTDNSAAVSHASAASSSTATSQPVVEPVPLTDKPVTAAPQVVGESMLHLLSNELDGIRDALAQLLNSVWCPVWAGSTASITIAITTSSFRPGDT